MSAETRITDLQKDIAARLAADLYFSNIPIFTERKSDIASDIDIALGAMSDKAGKSGVCCIVTQAIADAESYETPLPVLKIKLAVHVVENVLVNMDASGTGKAAADVALAVLNSLWLYSAPGLCGMLIPDKPAIIPVEDENGIAYEVQFHTQDMPMETAHKVSTPNATVTGDALPKTITLSCGTPGAAIYYTLDQSHPSAQNATAHIYTAPFSVSAPGWVRYGAFKSGQIGSDINLTVIT